MGVKTMLYEIKNGGVGQWRRFQGTGKLVIIPAPDRQKDPAKFLTRQKQDFGEIEYCPFCAGNLNKGLEREKKPEELKGALVEKTARGIKWIGEEDVEKHLIPCLKLLQTKH